MTIVKYLNPRNDVAFKKIFGTEKNNDILKHFLNDIIVSNDKKAIKEVILLNPMQHPEIIHSKQSTVDVLCEDEDGIQYIVEMQVAKVGGFEKRAQYYAAKAYSTQPQEGDSYKELKEVVFLAITEYIMFPDKEDYKSVHVTLDQKTYERDLKDFSFTFIELPKFKENKIDNLKTYEQKWCYFFKHAANPDNITELLKSSDEVIQKAYKELEAHNWTKEELKQYEANEKRARDAKAREEYIIEETRKEALAEGKAERKAERKAEGKAEGKAELVKLMLNRGHTLESISEITGLSLQEIESLKRL